MNNVMRLPLSSGKILSVYCDHTTLVSGFESASHTASALAKFTKPNTLFKLDDVTYLLVNDVVEDSHAMELSLIGEKLQFERLMLIGDLPTDRKLSYDQEHGENSENLQVSNFFALNQTVYIVTRDAQKIYQSSKGEMSLIEGSQGLWMIAKEKTKTAYAISLNGAGEKVHLSQIIDCNSESYDAVVAAEYADLLEKFCLVTLDFEDDIIRGFVERKIVKDALPEHIPDNKIPQIIRAVRLTKKRMWIYESRIENRDILFYFKPGSLPLKVVDFTESSLVKAETSVTLKDVGIVTIPTCELYQLLEGRDMTVGELISLNSVYPTVMREDIEKLTNFFEKYSMLKFIQRDGYFKFRHVRSDIYNLTAKMNKRDVGINVRKKLDSPPTYKFEQRIIFDVDRSIEEQLNIKKLVDRICFARNYRQKIHVQFYDDNKLVDFECDNRDFDVFRILNTGEKAVALFSVIDDKALVCLGWEHKLGSKIQVHTTELIDLPADYSAVDVVSQVVINTYPDFRLDLPEIRNLAEHRGILQSAPVKRARTIQTYTHQSKTECYVDLTYTLGNTVERVRYNILGRQHTSSRNLKACAEAMAIRNFLITRLGTNAKVMVGSQSLRLKVSSAKLHKALKGDISNFMQCNDWNFVRYVLTRAYDTPVSLENVRPAEHPHSEMFLDLGRDLNAMKLEECLNIGAYHYMITYHAVQRSAERMELRSALSGWGFITQHILRACCTEESEAKVLCRYNEDTRSTSRITPSGWTYVTKPDESLPDMLNVVTTFKSFTDRRQEECHNSCLLEA